MSSRKIQSILISRTDSIGDVILTLPIAHALRARFPNAHISFLGKSYTRPVIERCSNIDEFVDLSDYIKPDWSSGAQRPDCVIHVFPDKRIARATKRLGVPIRIGTTNRIYHWWYCNRLVPLSRKNSELHETQLNMKLLAPLGINDVPTLDAMNGWAGLNRKKALPPRIASLLVPNRFHLILHPKSQGSAREWRLEHFVELVHQLPADGFQIFVSGTAPERALLEPMLQAVGDRVIDITGKMSLDEFITFIGACDGLVANSTGPLHIAAALGKTAIGIYPPMRPIHPGRWAPIGAHAKVFVITRNCDDCRHQPTKCHCIQDIAPSSIVDYLLDVIKRQQAGR